MIKVSVIIAAYNVEDYIGRCIESIINQTLSEIEIIVVNDGSTDQTLKIINKYKELDKRLIVINKKNGGVQSARNEGIKSAKGNTILLVDGDDWLDKDALYNLYNELEHKKLDIVCYGYYEAASKKENIQFRNEYTGIYEHDQFLRAILQNKVVPALWCKLIRREFIEINNINLPEDIAFGEDLASTVKLACHFPKVSIINKCYYYYYVRKDSVTNNITEKALDLFKAFDYIKSLLIENEYYSNLKEEYEFLYYYHLYFERVVGQTLFNKIHKKFFFTCKDKQVNKINNHYIRDFKTNLSFNLKVWLFIYSINYYIAINTVRVWRFMYELKKNSSGITKNDN